MTGGSVVCGAEDPPPPPQETIIIANGMNANWDSFFIIILN